MPYDDRMTKSVEREIIQDFADDIKKRKQKDATPSKVVIPFRNEHRNETERDVVSVPIEILRFRKENGRIISNVLSYEQEHEILKENSDATQAKLRKFLSDKDPEKTKELINSIRSSGQRDPAVITCDGFLINGNRRKVAIDRLYEDTNQDEYLRMKVVILPGKDDPGGPPTKKEIEQIENRYQLQSDGKSEYTRLDQAISIRHKRDSGMTLKEILIDDPNFTHAEAKKLKQEEKKLQNSFLGPLKCVDDYLYMLDRTGLYETISTGHGDRRGKWEAFLDYYICVKVKLKDEKKRNKELGIEESEIGKIEEIAFKMIRKHEFKDIGKIHHLMRDLPSMINNLEARKELYHILDIEWELDRSESGITDDSAVSERSKDRIWGNKNAQEFIHRVKKAKRYVDYKKEKETPMTLLKGAKKKLQHDEMNVSSVDLNDLKKLMQLCRDIASLANDIENDAYHIDGNSLKDLKKKFS